VTLGLALPVTLLATGGSAALAALCVLAGIAIRAHILVQAPQQVPLS